MEIRRLGDSDLMLSRLGLGTWAIGGGDWDHGWGPQDDKASVAAIQRALDLGINWIDTAAAYGFGHAEKIVARALGGRRGRVIIATKGGLIWPAGVTRPRLDAASMECQVEDSLRRLQVDTIDLYQIHWPRPAADIEQGWEAINRLRAGGKIRFAGVSNFTMEQLSTLAGLHPVTSVQLPYNMIEYGIEKDLLPFCEGRRMGVLCYGPMRAGLLSGAVDASRALRFPASDWRSHNRDFRGAVLSVHLRLVQRLGRLAQACNVTLPVLAIAWVLRRNEVTAAIVGARSAEQIGATVGGASFRLTGELEREITKLLQSHRAELRRLRNRVARQRLQ